MSLWRYTAIPSSGGPALRGELAGESGADVRAALRRIGLQPIDLRRARVGGGARCGRVSGVLNHHLRRRRSSAKGDLFDSVATLLEAGVPLLETIDIVIGARSGRRSRRERAMLVAVRERLRSGGSFAAAMGEERGWFDGAEVAMIDAGQHSGELGPVLRTLAERHERSGELSAKLIGALTYPAVIACVGLGVAVFLSVRTLPELTSILIDAGVEVPRLTSSVMWLGRRVLSHGPLALLASGVLVGAALAGKRLAARWGIAAPAWVKGRVPSVVRRAAVSEALLSLAALVRVGVPLTEALRITAPTAGGPVSGGLGVCLSGAADRLEGGSALVEALENPLWFDEELRRLLVAGETGGDLADVLDRIGQRDRRRARRLIDRLAMLLEPAVILVLAFLVGLVVMAAVLPLVRLQEII